MRGYYVPLAAGAGLTISAFLPILQLNGEGYGGVPSISALWIAGLGAVAMLLAGLSLYTRKNSRHPLLLVGLVALGIEFLSWQWLERSVVEQVWASTQAAAIVGGGSAVDPGAVGMCGGLYLGVASAVAIALFGMTIVIKRVSSPYAPPVNDDD